MRLAWILLALTLLAPPLRASAQSGEPSALPSEPLTSPAPHYDGDGPAATEPDFAPIECESALSPAQAAISDRNGDVVYSGPTEPCPPPPDVTITVSVTTAVTLPKPGHPALRIKQRFDIAVTTPPAAPVTQRTVIETVIPFTGGVPLPQVIPAQPDCLPKVTPEKPVTKRITTRKTARPAKPHRLRRVAAPKVTIRKPSAAPSAPQRPRLLAAGGLPQSEAPTTPLVGDDGPPRAVTITPQKEEAPTSTPWAPPSSNFEQGKGWWYELKMIIHNWWTDPYRGPDRGWVIGILILLVVAPLMIAMKRLAQRRRR